MPGLWRASGHVSSFQGFAALFNSESRVQCTGLGGMLGLGLLFCFVFVRVLYRYIQVLCRWF